MASLFQGPPAVSFYDMLSGLGDTLQANAKLRMQAQRDQARQTAFSALDPNSKDFGQIATQGAVNLLKSGDIEGGTKLLTMAQAQAERDHAYQREGVNDAFREKQFRQTQSNADREWNYDPTEERAQQARAAGLDPNTPAGKEFTLTGKLPNNFVPGTTSKYGLSPVYGTKVGPDGKPMPSMVQLGQDGSVNEPKLPDGFQIARDPIKVDNGTYWTLLDPQTRQVIGTQPKDIAGAERAKEMGSAGGLAAADLPRVKDTAAQMLKTIDQVDNHPGKGWSLGIYSKVPTIPGTAQADFRAALGQLNGQNFLQAYQTLRGGGAITDIEGKKGEAALARLQDAQSPEAFNSALNDLRQVIKTGVLRAEGKARLGQQQPAAPANPRWATDESGPIVHQDAAGNQIGYDVQRKMWVPYQP